MVYNDQQLEAINSKERTILCLAGAGSGKSSVLVARINRLIHDGANSNSILALTFTNAAAFEMGEKYKRISTNSHSRIPEFKTFHGFCYSLIVKNKALRAKLGYAKIPEICEESKYKEIDKTVRMRLKFKISDAVLKNESLQSSRDKFEIDVYRKALRTELIDRNLITFDILCYDVCQLFIDNDEIIKPYKELYRYIHVDEFQDTDSLQFKFVASFPDTTSIFFVADALQNIYSWRGTTNEYVKKLSTCPGWEVVKLFENYRSTQQICDFANAFSKYAKPEYRIEMHGQRQGAEVEVITGSHVTFDNPVDTRHLSIVKERLKGSTIETAVLCRSNKEVEYIKNALNNSGISCTASSKSSEATDILKSATSNEYLIDWVMSCLDAETYSDYIRLKSTDPNKTDKELLSQFKSNPNVSKRLDKILQVRKFAIDDTRSYEDRFADICKLLRVKTKCRFDSSINSPRMLIEIILSQLEEETEGNIYVGTIHSSKGLEYERVFIMGVDDKMFELGTEEMNNLYYVAITRAREYLTVFKR